MINDISNALIMYFAVVGSILIFFAGMALLLFACYYVYTKPRKVVAFLFDSGTDWDRSDLWPVFQVIEKYGVILFRGIAVIFALICSPLRWLFRGIDVIFELIGAIFRGLFIILIWIIAGAALIGGIASLFAMLASIFHFQILGALGFLALIVGCCTIFGVAQDALK